MRVTQLPRTVGAGEVEMVPVREVVGLLCREDTYDAEIARSVRREYLSLPIQGRVVLDVGANVGAFTRHAALDGAQHVIAIEPEESNFRCLEENTRDLPNVTIIRGCLDLVDGETTIWLSSGRNPGNTSQTQRRGRFAQVVPCVSLTRIMAEYQPQSVKLDCEGAEYQIGRAHQMPEHVRDVAAEIHISGFGSDTAEQYAREYSDWRTVREPKITPSLWHTLGAWSR